MENKQYPEHETDLPLEEPLPIIEELHFEAPAEPEPAAESLLPLEEETLPETEELLSEAEEPLSEAEEPLPEVEEILFEVEEPLSEVEEPLSEVEELPFQQEVFAESKEPSAEMEAFTEDLFALPQAEASIPVGEPDPAESILPPEEDSFFAPMPEIDPDYEEEPAFTVGEAEFTPVELSQLSEEAMPSFMEPLSDADDEIPTPETPEDTVDIEAELLSDPTFAPPVPQEAPAEEVVDQEYSDAAVNAVPPAPPKKKKKKEDLRPTRKGRPKRKKGEGLFGIPNILATAVWMGLIVAIGVTLGRMLWVCAADVLAFGREDKKVTITVYEADTMEDIIDKLYDNGLIRYKSLFSLYADISEAEEDIKPGIYDLNTRYDYHALVNFMSPSSTRQVIELTIPEGYTCRQIFALLEENRVCTAVDIAAFAADGALSDYWFLEGVERGSEYCLEGYLFPDTYQFYKNSTPKEALEKMLDNFDYRFSEEMRAQIDTLNATVTDGSFTLKDVVTVASLIEKESAAPAESPTIASVIYNRLFNWDYPALLNIDAAIIYAQGGESDTIDTGIDSPYNTYRYTGLTPTPIANPGLSSLKAALEPESTNYYFYVLNPSTGTHQFSTTQEEHDGWIREFYN